MPALAAQAGAPDVANHDAGGPSVPDIWATPPVNSETVPSSSLKEDPRISPLTAQSHSDDTIVRKGTQGEPHPPEGLRVMSAARRLQPIPPIGDEAKSKKVYHEPQRFSDTLRRDTADEEKK
jgi:hypothetical protein